MTVDECLKACALILREEYPKVKAAMFRLEVFRHTKSKKAVYEIRDFLDHLASLHAEDIDESTANLHLNECHTHLRRAVVEPLEYMAEKQFMKIQNLVYRFGWIPFIHNPLSKPEFFQKMKEIKQLIVQGRIEKTTGKAAEIFDKAFGIGNELLAQINPTFFVLKGIFWFVGVIIVAFIGGYITNAYFK